VVVEKAGRKIGIVGLLTDLSDVVSSEVSLAIKYKDPKDVLNLYAAELKSKGCDFVIALTHLGYEGEAYTDFELASVTRNVDIIVGGHSHTRLKDYGKTVNPDGKKVIIVTDGKWGLNIGKLTVK
jgi:5'-nucleotidase